MELKTPSGHRVFLKSFLSFGQKRDIEKVFASKVKVDPLTQKSEVDGSVLYDAQDLGVKYLVEKIIDKDGKEYTGDEVLSVILSWSEKDGKLVYDKIDEITAIKSVPADSKKK